MTQTHIHMKGGRVEREREKGNGGREEKKTKRKTHTLTPI